MVLQVTNLNDSGPDSLRAAIDASGPRTIVFTVSGIIQLASPLNLTQPFCTISGQSAPGGGILLTGIPGGNANLLRIHANDVVVRYLRLRDVVSGAVGGMGQSPIGIVDCQNVMVDHCSWSWGLDDAQAWQSVVSPDTKNITIQWCLAAEGLEGHSTGLLIGGLGNYDVTPPDETYLKVRDISVHHNLFVHNYDRNPRVRSGGCQVINNVVYNWGSRVGVVEMGSNVDFINNYWKPGPMRQNAAVVYKYEGRSQAGVLYPIPSLYMAGNIVPGSFEDPGANNQSLITFNSTPGYPGFGPLPASYFTSTPLPQALYPITIETATAAYNSVLAWAGANARLTSDGIWIANPDSVDQRVLADVQNGTGWSWPVASPEAAGGFPTIG